MRDGETSLGGPSHNFPPTTWGLVSRFQSSSGPDYRRGLDELCRRYWKPVYGYFRIAWSKPNEDAKDLTQAFFLWLLEGDALSKYEPARGGFRKYLKTLLRWFLSHQHEALQAQKRGGGRRVVPLDDDAEALAAVVPDASGEDPQKAFDREWVNTVVDLAVERVRKRLTAEGRDVQFRVFEAYNTPEGTERPTYAEIAGRLGLKESDVRYHLSVARQAVREEIRRELAELTADPAELEEEWNELLGA